MTKDDDNEACDDESVIEPNSWNTREKVLKVRQKLYIKFLVR